MRRVSLFGEDFGHEISLGTLVRRYADSQRIALDLKTISSRGGLTRVHHEFDEYLGEVDGGRLDRPDLIVVATDSNCVGYAQRRHLMEKVVLKHEALSQIIAYAIPEPHIERWLLADAEAFREVVGKGCTLPKLKCNKDEYKDLLDKSVRDAGRKPILGGLEYAEDIIKSLNLARVEQAEPSFERTTRQIKAFMQQWKLSE